MEGRGWRVKKQRYMWRMCAVRVVWEDVCSREMLPHMCRVHSRALLSPFLIVFLYTTLPSFPCATCALKQVSSRPFFLRATTYTRERSSIVLFEMHSTIKQSTYACVCFKQSKQSSLQWTRAVYNASGRSDARRWIRKQTWRHALPRVRAGCVSNFLLKCMFVWVVGRGKSVFSYAFVAYVPVVYSVYG